jgi:hypothetical protein
MTAARYAAALGPEAGAARDFWLALFRRTYAAEFPDGDHQPGPTPCWRATRARYDAAAADGLAGGRGGVRGRGRGAAARQARPAGLDAAAAAARPRNVARILKAAFTFDGAARYAAYKIARHTGVEIEVTPLARAHPFLAAPGAWFELRRRQAEARRARLSSPNS